MIKKVKPIISWLLILALVGILIGLPPATNAVGSLSNVSDTLSRLKAAETGVSHHFKFTIDTALTEASKIQLDTSDFTFSGTPVVIDDSVSVGSPTIATNVVTIGGTGVTIAAGSIVEITGLTATNPAAGDYVITINTDPNGDANYTDGDSGSVAIQILTDEQVAVAGTVTSTISFSITNADIGFGTWTGTEKRWANKGKTGATGTEPATTDLTGLTASTNASGGLTITIQSANAGLKNGGAHTIGAKEPSLVADDSEGYAVYGKDGATLLVETGFKDTGTTVLTTSAQTFASYTTGPVSSDTVYLVSIAAIASTTPAGTYNDTLTLICTGNF